MSCVSAACSAQPTGQRSSGLGPFAPPETRTLQDFGAIGDGRTDDTAAIARAFANSDDYCLDGHGRSYKVTGTLRVAKSFCLRNTTLVQAAAPVDTSRYIVRSCAIIPDPSSVKDCGDPAIPPDQVERLWKSLSVRTLLIRSGDGRSIKVNLNRVKIDRGPYSEGGSRTDSAGIWLDGADRVDFRNVEITGNGKGYGLLITDARNVTLTNLWIHDLIWAPYRGDGPLSQANIARVGWNSVPIHEFREKGRGAGPAAKFYGARIQEQLTCAFLANVSNVRIEGARIERCMARLDTGNLPWQADGLAIGQSSSEVVIKGARIDSTWEGVDIGAGGKGIDGLVISDLSVSNSFGFGLKMGYQLRNARVSRLDIDGVGIAGVILYGPVRNTRISGASIRNVGTVRSDQTRFSPWPPGNRAGIRIDRGGTATETPDNLILEDISVSGNPTRYEFGVLNTGGRRIQTVRFRANGFGEARARGVSQNQ